ncbi:MAG: MFS transporter [Actinobacteria bacterium]|mgnify:CR=1 FL=1|jgi:predicted MFS family arabinose efflux permease|nr:MFS transporter [Actinomycetota bacterium]
MAQTSEPEPAVPQGILRRALHKLGAGPLWHHPDFLRLWVGDTASQLGASFGGIALPYLAVTVLAATSFQMGLLGTLQGLGFLLIGLPAGALVDRWRKRTVMLSADLGRAILLLSITAAWWLGWLTFAQLAVVATAVGVLTVFFDVSYQSYLPFLVGHHHVVEGNAKLQASQSVSQAAGPALGGVAIKYLGAADVVAVNGVGYLASATALWRIRFRETPPARETRRPLRVEITEGLAFVLRHPLLRRLLACTGIGNLTGSAESALAMLYMVRELHLSAVTIGLIEAVGAIGGFCGALIVTPLTRWLGEGATIIVTAAVFAPMPFVYPLASVLPAVPTLIVGYIAFMAMVVAYNIATVSFRQRLCPPTMLGRMNASARFIVWGTIPIGSFVGGVLGSHVGVLATLWIASTAGLLSVLPVASARLWRLRELPSHDSAGSAHGDDEVPAPTSS